MAGGRSGELGGIRSLLADPERLEALEIRLIELGLRLRDAGTEELEWRDVVLLDASLGPDPAWNEDRMLLAAAVDALNLLVWFQTEDGEKNRNRPKPIERPGVEPDETVTQYGVGEAVSIEEMNRLLGWRSASG